MPNFTRPPVRRVVPFDDGASRGPPPLAALLAENPRVANVLGQAFIRRLCYEQSCSTIGQLLSLDRPQLDSLLDMLRPLPGHRDIFIDFLNSQRDAAAEERKTADEAAAAAAGDAGGGPTPPTATSGRPASASAATTPAQQRAWRITKQLLRSSSIAAKRGGDGHISHLIQQQPLHWGFVKGPPPKPVGYTSSTRVLTFGRSRIIDYGGPAPNSPPKGPAGGGSRKPGGYGTAASADHF